MSISDQLRRLRSGLPVRTVASRSQIRALKLVLSVLVLVNIAYYVVRLLAPEMALEDMTRQFYNSYDTQMGLDPHRSQKAWSQGKAAGSFEDAVKLMFAQVESDKERFWLAHTGLTETSVDIVAKRFLPAYAEEDDLYAKRPDLFYDPRFTLAMYLSEMKHQYLQKGVKRGRGRAQSSPITLPFHWADWMDLTLLNEDLLKPVGERISCAYIRLLTNNDPEPSYFCYDNEKLTDEEVAKTGFLRHQLPGFVIHSHSSHDDRPFNDIRVLEARSYALTNLPRPFRVVILNGPSQGGGTYEFEVDQVANQRLATLDMVQKYFENSHIGTLGLNEGSILNIDHTKEYVDLVKRVSARHLAAEDDVLGMYKTLHQKDKKALRELELPEKLFSYPRELVAEQIAYYEAQDKGLLLVGAQNYFEGLQESTKYDGTNEPTYFKMAVIRIDDDRNRDREWGWHYDWRFFLGALNYDRVGWTAQELVVRTNIILDRLFRNWSRFAEEKGIVSWIMHGPLLSWYWDGLMFPFDVDIDIQMPVAELARLARDHNQTLVVEDPLEGYGKYLIDIGTYMHNRDILTTGNHIDGRFVDVDLGIYIDITAVAKSKANPPGEYENNDLAKISKPNDNEDVEVYNDRRKHFYTRDQLLPLRYLMMGGVPTFIPHTITDRLIFEYLLGLLAYEFQDWYFVLRLNLWLRKEQVATAFPHYEVVNTDGSFDKERLLTRISSMTDDEALRLLRDDAILVEYYLTKDLTDLHTQERTYLFDSMGSDSAGIVQNQMLRDRYNALTAGFKMGRPLRKALYDFELLERVKHHKGESGGN